MRGKNTKTIHGQSNTKIYYAWANMMQRCYNTKKPNFKDYGGRGIGVYSGWHKFANFLHDVGLPPTSEHTLERIYNDGDYEPGNVRWATQSEQSYNKRTTKEIKLALRNNPLDKVITLEYTSEQKGVVTMEMPTFNFDVDIPSLREAIGLTHTEARVLLMLLQEEIATHEQLVVVNFRVRQLMYSLRNKLKAHGINIVNDRDIGYSIPLKYKLRIKNLIEGELMEELNKAHEISEKLINE